MDQAVARIRIDGVAVAIGEIAVLLRGRPGSGRSDLALRLIDEGARLVSDEQVELERRGDRLYAMAPSLTPQHLLGRLEARGIGIMPVPHIGAPVPLGWVVDMTPIDQIERLPAATHATYLGIDVPAIQLDPAAISATAKLRLAVKCGPDLIIGRTE